jgi:hypothetical protein
MQGRAWPCPALQGRSSSGRYHDFPVVFATAATLVHALLQQGVGFGPALATDNGSLTNEGGDLAKFG